MNITTNSSPPLQVSQWLNSPKPVSLEALQGRVVVLHTFQMLCPGCVSHGLPQALRIHRLFPKDKVSVIGLHTVFEHHDVMGPQALRVFLAEYRIPFPVGIDQADSASPVPLTMRAYGLRGTPSVVIFDPQGRVRLSHFGQIDDLQLGVVVGQLLAETSLNATVDLAASDIGCNSSSACSDGACSLQA
jgi:hypothetical protein